MTTEGQGALIQRLRDQFNSLREVVRSFPCDKIPLEDMQAEKRDCRACQAVEKLVGLDVTIRQAADALAAHTSQQEALNRQIGGLHRVLSDANALIDPEANPKLSADIKAYLEDCEQVACKELNALADKAEAQQEALLALVEKWRAKPSAWGVRDKCADELAALLPERSERT
jgi:hypothetical protein